jgi:hypothetical protein
VNVGILVLNQSGNRHLGGLPFLFICVSICRSAQMASGISPSRPSFRPCCASPPKAHEGGVTKPGPLQNPATAVAAWARFRRLMRWMFSSR